MIRRRLFLIALTTLTVASIIATAALGFYIDRQQCKGAAQAVSNSRTMWEYAIEQNPGPAADQFAAELDRRLPPAHCRGGALIVDNPDISEPPVTHSTP